MTIAVVTAEDCEKAWDQLAPEQRAWIEDRRMYWQAQSIEDHWHGVSTAAVVWDELGAKQRWADIELLQGSVSDVRSERQLQATLNTVLVADRQRAQEYLGSPAESSDLVAYAIKLVAYLEKQDLLVPDASERATIRLMIDRIKRALPDQKLPDRFAQRQMRDGFDGVEQAKVSQQHLDRSRIAELAAMEKLSVRHWIEITGVGVGIHESFEITTEEVSFRKWGFDYIKQSPQDWQIEMLAENETPPLTFPCTPKQLVEFVRNAPCVHCFVLPEEFEKAVDAHGGQATDCLDVSDRAVQLEEKPPRSRERRDDLAIEIDLLAQQKGATSPTPDALMELLSARAGTAASCVIEAGENRGERWIRWKNRNTGKVRMLDMEGLKKRVERRTGR